MRARLIIRFGADPSAPVQWLRLAVDGRPEGGVASGTLAEAATQAGGRTVMALMPGFDVLLLSALIPTQSRQKLLRAIPYALEDQLADDIDDLHFVPGRRDPEGSLPVAVIARARLQEWLDACGEAGLDVEQIHPEILALPYEAGAWTLLLEDGEFLLRSGPQSGFAGDACNAAPLLEAALEEAGEAAPRRLQVYAPADPTELGGLDLELEYYRLAEPLPTMAGNLDPRQSIDLRSGEFARKRGMSGQWRRWQVAAALLVAWVLVDTSAAYLAQWQQRSELATLNAEIEQIYQQAFPGAGRLVNPRQQVENRLRAMRGGGSSDNGMLELLGKIGPTLKSDPPIEMQALNYRNGEFDLEFFAESLQAVDALKQRLDELDGIRAEVRTARAEGERVQGRLRIGAS